MTYLHTKKISRVVLLIILCSGCNFYAQNLAEQRRKELKEAFYASERFSLAFIDLMPDSLFGYKVTPETMTYAEQWRHCAVYTCGQLSAKLNLVNPYGEIKPPIILNKEETINEVKKMYAFVQQALDNMKKDEFTKSVQFGNDTLQVWQFLYAMENHIIHHRGQCVIYMRMNQITPKGYYGW